MALTPKRDRQLAKVLTAVRAHVAPGRSPLYRWMRLRHDALLAAFVEIPPNWTIFAQTVASLGITDADGKPPSAEVARQTWYRVRRDVAAAHAAHSPKPVPVLATGEVAPAVRIMTPEPERPRRMLLDIKPARAIAELPPTEPPTVQASQASVESPAPAAQNPEEQLRRVFGAMDATTTPMPKIIR